MTTLVTDGKKLVMDYLRSHSAVSAITSSVRSTMPDETADPWVKGTLIDMTTESEPAEHLILYALQFDCYAGADQEGRPGWPEANQLGLTVRAALKELSGVQAGATVSCVYVRGPREIIDSDFEPERARTIVEADVYIHA